MAAQAGGPHSPQAADHPAPPRRPLDRRGFEDPPRRLHDAALVHGVAGPRSRPVLGRPDLGQDQRPELVTAMAVGVTGEDQDGRGWRGPTSPAPGGPCRRGYRRGRRSGSGTVAGSGAGRPPRRRGAPANNSAVSCTMRVRSAAAAVVPERGWHADDAHAGEVEAGRARRVHLDPVAGHDQGAVDRALLGLVVALDGEHRARPLAQQLGAPPAARTAGPAGSCRPSRRASPHPTPWASARAARAQRTGAGSAGSSFQIGRRVPKKRDPRWRSLTVANRHSRRPGGGVNVVIEPARSGRRRGRGDGDLDCRRRRAARPRPLLRRRRDRPPSSTESPARTTISPGGASRQQTWMEVSSTANTSTCTLPCIPSPDPPSRREENP